MRLFFSHQVFHPRALFFVFFSFGTSNYFVTKYLLIISRCPETARQLEGRKDGHQRERQKRRWLENKLHDRLHERRENRLVLLLVFFHLPTFSALPCLLGLTRGGFNWGWSCTHVWVCVSVHVWMCVQHSTLNKSHFPICLQSHNFVPRGRWGGVRSCFCTEPLCQTFLHSHA